MSVLFTSSILVHHLTYISIRILHIPSFQREYIQYWQNPESVNKAFIYQLILVLGIGASISQDSGIAFQSSARQWIYATQSWLSGPFEKSRLNIGGLQVQCLLLLARQITSVDSDLVSTSTISRILSLELTEFCPGMGCDRNPPENSHANGLPS